MPEIANIQQEQAWNGPDGLHWTEHEDRYNGAVVNHFERLKKALIIRPADRVLDIGCGTGETTRYAASQAKDGEALGVDLSEQMLGRARERAAEQGIKNVRFEHGDAQVYPFDPASFDVVMSRFGVMFFADPAAAWANIARALKPGGRLTILVWQPPSENEWTKQIFAAIERPVASPPPGTPSPFGMCDREWVTATLTNAGLTDVAFEDVRVPMWFGKDGDDAYAFQQGNLLVRGRLGELDDAGKQRVLGNLRAALKQNESPDGVVINSATWIITARRA